MRRHLDRIIGIVTLFIIVIGLTALYSAAYENVRVSNQVFYSQLTCAVIGVFLMLLLNYVDYRRFYDVAYVFYGITTILLILVFWAGKYALGAQRWLTVGPISFQPSELAKFSLILALGRYFSERRPAISFNFSNFLYILWGDLVVPLLITALPMFLIFKQPDLGTAFLFLGIFIIMLLASGLEYHYFLGFFSMLMAAVPFGWHFLRSYQKDRLLVFMNPNIDPLGAGYTIIQSKIAVGSGQLIGKGWLSGTQNQLNFLPERHTDFIFSVIGEEWGLLGTMFLLTCYFVLIYYGLKTAEQVKDKFGVLVSVGIIGILMLQVIINMGMVMGLCPVVGLTLPLVSYGRSSFLVFIVMIGFLLNLSKRRTIF